MLGSKVFLICFIKTTADLDLLWYINSLFLNPRPCSALMLPFLSATQSYKNGSILSITSVLYSGDVRFRCRFPETKTEKTYRWCGYWSRDACITSQLLSPLLYLSWLYYNTTGQVVITTSIFDFIIASILIVQGHWSANLRKWIIWHNRKWKM